MAKSLDRTARPLQPRGRLHVLFREPMPWAEVQFTDTPKSYNNAKVLTAFEPTAKAPVNEIGTALAEQFKTLRSVLNRAARERLRAPLVKGEITIAKGAESRERVLTLEEETKYLGGCSEPLKSVATIIVDMGFRPEEVFRIKWSCVNFDTDRIFNERGKSKAARRQVKMTARVRGMLYERWVAADKPKAGYVFTAAKASAGHIVPNTIYNSHLDAVKASGVAPFVLYELRHTCLTRLGQSGCTPWEFAKIAGHANVAVSAHYVHVPDADTDAAIERMSDSNTNQQASRGDNGASRTKSVQNQNRRTAVADSKLSVVRRAAKS